MVKDYIPERGDIVWIDFNPQAGHEQAGKRPAIIISPRIYNGKVGLSLLCPVTKQSKGYPFEVELPDGLEVRGVVLADQIKNLDWRTRNIEYICKAPDRVVAEIQKKIYALLE